MNETDSLYLRLGGEAVLREFVDKLYDFMDYFPPVTELRSMHPDDLSNARDRLFMFLSGMLGGPPLYTEKFGHPFLRQKHMHFKIGDAERDQWMLCAQNASNQLNIDNQVRDEMIMVIGRMADHLRNTDSGSRVAYQS